MFRVLHLIVIIRRLIGVSAKFGAAKTKARRSSKVLINNFKRDGMRKDPVCLSAKGVAICDLWPGARNRNFVAL